MAHAHKPDFVFRRNGRVHLNQRGRQFSRLLAAEVCTSAVVMLDTPCSEVVWRVLATHSIRRFSLHFPSRASPCAITFQLESTKSALVQSISYRLLDLLLSLELKSHVLESNSHFTPELSISALGDLIMSNLAYLTVSVLPSWSEWKFISLFFVLCWRVACVRLLPFTVGYIMNTSCFPRLSRIS